MERVLDFTHRPVRLSVKLDQLVIKEMNNEAQPITTPLNEIAILIASNYQIIYTHAVLAGIAENNGIILFCDKKCLPLSMMIPLTAHCTQSERFSLQARISKPMCKRIWQSIIKAKIKSQGQLLKNNINDDGGLINLSKQVRSGDPDNFESQAARIYWTLIFEDPNFRRKREGESPNHLLNYGYAILRAIFARAICATGLHPSLGIHHHNRYNAFCLADDLMEPFRPIVDQSVLDIIGRWG